MSRIRNPEETRRKLIESAFGEIYQHGFRAASLDRILGASGVTKGALYHHFPSKEALGLAVLDEVVRGQMLERWLGRLRDCEDPLQCLADVITEMAETLSDEEIANGCPLNNLAQELSGTDTEFRVHIEQVYEAWRDGIATALQRGQANGNVRDDVDPARAATFIVAAVEGSAGVAKSTRSREQARAMAEGLVAYLGTLRPLAVAAI